MFGLFRSNKEVIEEGDIRMQRKLMSRGKDPEIVEVTNVSEEDAEVEYEDGEDTYTSSYRDFIFEFAYFLGRK